MKNSSIPIPEEIPSNRVEDQFNPCWIVKTQQADRRESITEQGWIALVVFEDSAEMLEMIGDWANSSLQREPDPSMSFYQEM